MEIKSYHDIDDSKRIKTIIKFLRDCENGDLDYDSYTIKIGNIEISDYLCEDGFEYIHSTAEQILENIWTCGEYDLIDIINLIGYNKELLIKEISKYIVEYDKDTYNLLIKKDFKNSKILFDVFCILEKNIYFESYNKDIYRINIKYTDLKYLDIFHIQEFNGISTIIDNLKNEIKELDSQLFENPMMKIEKINEIKLKIYDLQNQ